MSQTVFSLEVEVLLRKFGKEGELNMLEISSDLINKIKDVSGRLRKTYGDSLSDRERIRAQLYEAGAHISKVERLEKDALERLLANREIAAVDGSVNQTKGEAPHILYLFQALAKTTTGTSSFTCDLYSPLVDERDHEESGITIRKHILAKLELEAAYRLLEKSDIGLLLMDGALYHYRIDAPDEWAKLREKALREDVLLVGMSEEITTENLIKLSAFQRRTSIPKAYDRDLLFGVLEQGEMVYLEEIQQKAGLESMWVRFSTNPAISGFDMLIEQAEEKYDVARLLYTLTPQHGRGIPLWLDFIDREVRVTDQMIEALVEQYIDPEIQKRLFTKKRYDRPY